ncbi:haloacid dehalogenase [Amylibacter marinus]|uniref:Haloacid dehalogenase n=1 Tax=Amylibacter marinus TaxID=1475483 RepID=A0ABQ5VRC3_9RHOB|nr:HAD family hydrolase [Amylibacter marinus]GLQ33809.1 haloacid dehalogenase [Amylibacter marinus]
MQQIKAVGFDADDTLWHNEHHFAQAQARFAELMSDFIDAVALSEVLLEKERTNVGKLGYGIKSFTLSMMEAAIEASDHRLEARHMATIIDIGREMMDHPVELLDKVLSTLQTLAPSYELMLITKGDLVDQERKVLESGLAQYFQAIEIVSEKHPQAYRDIFARHGGAGHCAMIGNSVKSDVLPAIDAGGWGVHVPYHTTWELELAEPQTDHARYLEATDIAHAAELIRQL